jgi:hypothetical protein
MSSKPIQVSLAVIRSESGGNTRDGRYFYSFTPAIINVTEPDTEVIFTLTEETAAAYAIADIYVNDISSTFSGKKVGAEKRSLSIVNSNKVQQLVFVSLLVMHGDIRVNCDPQMTNSPGGVT